MDKKRPWQNSEEQSTQLGQRKRRRGEGPLPQHHQDLHDQLSTTGIPESLPPLPPINGSKLPELVFAPFTHSSRLTEKHVNSTKVIQRATGVHLVASDVADYSDSIDSCTTFSMPRNYERLEFLGDTHLHYIATNLIFWEYSHLLVGKQARLREILTCNDLFAEFSRAYHFDAPGRIVADPHTLKTVTPKAFSKILADVFEAYIAAVVVSTNEEEGEGAGLKKAGKWMRHLWEAWGVLEPYKKGITPYSNGTQTAGTVYGGTPNVASIGCEIRRCQNQDHPLKAWLSAKDLDMNASNPRDVLHRLIGDNFVQVEYADETPNDPLALSDADTHNRENWRKFAIYVHGWGYQRELIGCAVGTSKKEAVMLASMDALVGNRTDIVAKCCMQKQKAKEERRLKREAEEAKKLGAVPGKQEPQGTKERDAVLEKQESDSSSTTSSSTSSSISDSD